MPDKNLENLEQPDNWDFGHSEKRRPAKEARVIVSVPFSQVEYRRVSESAEHEGMKPSAFIREAALEKAGPPRNIPFVAIWYGGVSFLTGNQPIRPTTPRSAIARVLGESETGVFKTPALT